ncbi:MAG: crystallin J1 [Treponema sp. GWB1_62_6]|nr:MAG: crystallin J1 [Treponema sp. GWA1_62_8]OHE65444.1 MAG: crystallin J1 [Treponema sp. GWC1_61_84]OHE69541.1 MAG: crystallin J1 [Treponema sp. GWB1_62_6]HCM25858.1 crystallin J1 [Treponema sp.]
MLSREELLADRKLYVSKARGCLAGLGVGDAMGDTGRNQEYRARYGVITNMYSDAKSTDDTEFGILTACCLIESKGKPSLSDVRDAWKKYILDRGGAKKRAGRPLYGAIENLGRGMMPPDSGKYNVMNTDDGAAMRISPVGIFRAGDPEGAAALAAIDACISHDADGIWAAQAVAASVAVAMANGSVAEIMEAGRKVLPAGSWMARAMDIAMRICDEKPDIEVAFEDLHTRLWTPEHATAAEAIPQVYAIFRLTGGDFRRGLLWSANFGRDADTISGLVCSLSGALHGIEAIPPSWVEQIRHASGVCLDFSKDKDLLELADQLVDLSRGA